MPMKSADLYRELRAGLGGWFRAERFKRARAQLGWSRPPLLIWFQCDQWGWDPYAGSGFFVNFQIGGGVSPWSGPTERLQHFLTDAELEAARELQNGVIRRLSPPPPHHVQALRSAFARSSSDPEALVEALMQRSSRSRRRIVGIRTLRCDISRRRTSRNGVPFS
jgi:hypothetical protein